jgi:hypothetical protein
MMAWPASIAFVSAAILDHGGPYSRCSGRGNTAEPAARAQLRLLPLRDNADLPVIFSSFFKQRECLLCTRPAGKHRYEVLPTDVASILFLVQAALVILIESFFPAVQFWIHNRHLRTTAGQNTEYFAIVETFSTQSVLSVP